MIFSLFIVFYVVHSKFFLVSDKIIDKIVDKTVVEIVDEITMLFFLTSLVPVILVFHSYCGRKCVSGAFLLLVVSFFLIITIISMCHLSNVINSHILSLCHLSNV